MMKKNKTITDDENGCVQTGGHRVWVFVHREDFKYKTDILKVRGCNFKWLSIAPDGTITVKGSYDRGYAWDGCTPKWNFLHFTWGTCDGRLTRFGKGDYKPFAYYASMVHDALYQYKRCVPVTRKETDLIFYKILKEAGFMWSWLYYLCVRAFGWWFRGWQYKLKEELSAEFQNKQDTL